MGSKVRLLMVLKYLLNFSSEINPVSQTDILNYLKENGINTGKNTITDIMKTITKSGFDLITVRKGKYNHYYILSEYFDMTEARLLADAIISASFITKNKTDALLSKVFRLTDKEMEVHYLTDIIRENKQKYSNCSTYYTIDVIQKALLQHKQIRFQYFVLDENKHRVYKHNGKIYELCPITLMNAMNKYYLIGYDPKIGDGKERTFRIDRMDNASVSDKEVCTIPFDIEECVGRYQSSIFGMYSGRKIIAEFEFDFKAMSMIYDQYGEDIEIEKIEDNRFFVRLPIEDSPTFWGWLFVIGKHIKIISPNFLIKEYVSRLSEIKRYIEEN